MSATELPICNAPTVKYRLLSWGEGKNLIDKKIFVFLKFTIQDLVALHDHIHFHQVYTEITTSILL